MLKEQFDDVLAEFGRTLGRDLALDGDNALSLDIDGDVVANIAYMPDSDTIALFALVGGFGETTGELAAAKARALLEMNDVGGPTLGFTLALDADAGAVLAMDRRNALEISSADALAAWCEALVTAVRAVRERFERDFPQEGGL